MSEPYELVVMFPQTNSTKQLIMETHSIIEKFEGQLLTEDSVLYLTEFEGEEPAAEEITDSDDALQKLIAWPVLGSLSYFLPEGKILVSYIKAATDNIPQAIEIFIREYVFEEGGDKQSNKFIDLAYDLHHKFQAKRTILDWGLHYQGFDLLAELQQFNSQEIQSRYGIVDVNEVQHV